VKQAESAGSPKAMFITERVSYPIALEIAYPMVTMTCSSRMGCHSRIGTLAHKELTIVARIDAGIPFLRKSLGSMYR
jgi:hypothetical protein